MFMHVKITMIVNYAFYIYIYIYYTNKVIFTNYILSTLESDFNEAPEQFEL